ncbi:MAG TPA: hypothetical protein VKE95_19750 [Burkholderiales bacterium]|nr:hypothetical protein [Burkholderiales bacterium]
MALRLVFGLLALAAISACSSSDSAGNMYARDPYAVSASRNPASFSEAFGSPKLPARYQSGALDEIYGSSAAMARASVLPPLDDKRKIVEQDCSKPIALDQGNLRCK